MKAKKEHDSDEEHDETQDEILPASTQVSDGPISPPSQGTPKTNRRKQMEREVLNYNYMDDPEEGVFFEELSQEILWPYWDTKEDSIVEYKNNFLGYLVCLILLFALGWISFMVLPLILSLTKSAVHRCPKWFNEVKDNSLLGFSSMEDKVMSFTVGNFAIAVSRKYLLYISLSVIWGIVLYLLMTSGVGYQEQRPLTTIKWQDFREDWGFGSYLEQPRKSIRTFDRKYLGKGVTWDGYIVQVNALSEDSLAHFYHASSILVKMVPDDKEEDDASLVLTLSENMTEDYKEDLLSLDIGDHIRFNATIVSQGDNSHLHHLHSFGFKKTEGSAHVNLHAFQNGRYKIRKEGDHPEDGE